MLDNAEITHLLRKARNGNRDALEELVPHVYDELKGIARRQLARSPTSTMNTTALAHEAYLKIFSGGQPLLNDRQHFFSVICLAMRQLLQDHARRQRANKRGGDAIVLANDFEEVAAVGHDPRAFISLDRALEHLAELDPRLADVVQLRYFCGLDVEEVAVLKGRSSRTVLRDWRKARAFLIAELDEDGFSGGSSHG